MNVPDSTALCDRLNFDAFEVSLDPFTLNAEDA